MRKLHRFIAVFAVVFGLYIGATGTFIQLIDLKTLLIHAPDNDPDLQAIREGHDGPQNFQVIVDGDYFAAALPADFDFDAALSKLAAARQAAAGGAPASFIEFRMQEGRPVAQVASQGKLLRFDAQSGDVLTGPDAAAKVALPPGGNRPSLRNTFKAIHRMTAYGDYATPIFALIALSLCVMLFTGLVMYFKLLTARARMGRSGLFWSAGGGWRNLHRGISIAASALLVVVVLSGTIEAFGSVGVSAYRVIHHGRPGLTADVSSPLQAAALPAMLHITLNAYRAEHAGTPIKVLRLRYFAGMPQGVIVAGGAETQQYAFNAATGDKAPLSGPGYPYTGQPFGWDADQMLKQIHRGDIIGLTGRWLSLFTGLSLLFLCISGLMMYWDMWSRRRKAGQSGLFWS